MDEQSLMDFIRNMMMRGDADAGEGDYKDLLANFMHSQNHGADPSQLMDLLTGFSPERQEKMKDYGGGPSIEKNPFIRAGRSSVNELLGKK
jgi:hypothetical protein